MLEARGVGHRHVRGGPWVVRDVDLTVAPGEVVGLFGPSGVGKTTLGHILSGYLTPTAGRVLVDGAALPGRGYVPVQCIHQHPELAVNPRWRLSRTLCEAWEPDESLVSALGIAPAWLSRHPHELSGGELQRIVVARALGPKTRYLVADEMTAMLDAPTQARIWTAVLAHCRARAVGLVVVSHDAALLDRLCSRRVTLPLGVP